jgi:hypothetical protein
LNAAINTFSGHSKGEIMGRTIAILFAISLSLVATGGLTYRFGTSVNLRSPQLDELSSLAGSPGDKWLFLGGLLILLGGAVALAAVKSLIQDRRELQSTR